MLLYIDSFFAEGREREVKPLEVIPQTLNKLYLTAMREHTRKGVFLNREDGRWRPMPDWRFDRHVIRIGLYLRERAGIQPGDRIAVVSELRPEWLLADFAAAALGAISVAVAPAMDGDSLIAALAEAAPKVAFASGRALEKVHAGRGSLPSLEKVIVFDPVVDEGRAEPFASALDLGSTLDTPERAQPFRKQVRELSPDHPAMRHYERGAGGSFVCEELTQTQAIERVAPHWLEHPASRGDLAYVVGPEVTLGMRLLLYAFVGDGYTTVALGNLTGGPEEIADLKPHKIIAPPALLESAVRRARANAKQRVRGLGDWIRRAARRSLGRWREEREAVLEALGGHARWVSPTAPLDPQISQQLGAAVAVATSGTVLHNVAAG